MKITWICFLFATGQALGADFGTTSIGTTIITTILTNPTTTTTTTTMGTPGLMDVVSGVGTTTTLAPPTSRTTTLAHSRALEASHPKTLHAAPSGHVVDDRTNTPKPSVNAGRGGVIGGGQARPRADETNVTITVTSSGNQNRLEDLVGHHDESPIVDAAILPVVPVIVAVNRSDDGPVRNRRQMMMQPGFGNFGGGLGMGGVGGFGGVPVTTGFQGAQVVSPAFGGGLGTGMMGGFGGVRSPVVVDTVTVEDTIVPGKK